MSMGSCIHIIEKSCGAFGKCLPDVVGQGWSSCIFLCSWKALVKDLGSMFDRGHGRSTRCGECIGKVPPQWVQAVNQKSNKEHKVVRLGEVQGMVGWGVHGFSISLLIWNKYAFSSGIGGILMGLPTVCKLILPIGNAQVGQGAVELLPGCNLVCAPMGPPLKVTKSCKRLQGRPKYQKTKKQIVRRSEMPKV